MPSFSPPLLAITQGDPAGIGPEICLRVAERWNPSERYVPMLLIDAESVASLDGTGAFSASTEKLRFVDASSIERRLKDGSLLEHVREFAAEGKIVAVSPLQFVQSRQRRSPTREPVELGSPGAADAAAAVAAIDLALELCVSGQAAGMVTGPINKASIAEHLIPDFRGHTDYIAEYLVRAGTGEEACEPWPRSSEGDSRKPEYGRDYLMAFLGRGLNVALLSTHVPLVEAIRAISTESVVTALRCLDHAVANLKGERSTRRRIALAGLNPHAGEGGLLGSEDGEVLVPAVTSARAEGIDVSGPYSADTLFARARGGEFDWVLALYHDQGLIAVKTLAFGETVNWTAGIPIVRTSVDHGTAYGMAGLGTADPSALFAAIDAAVSMVTVEGS